MHDYNGMFDEEGIECMYIMTCVMEGRLGVCL